MLTVLKAYGTQVIIYADWTRVGSRTPYSLYSTFLYLGYVCIISEWASELSRVEYTKIILNPLHMYMYRHRLE